MFVGRYGYSTVRVRLTLSDITAIRLSEEAPLLTNRQDSTNLWVNQDQLSMELDKFLIATEGLKLQPFYNPLMSLCNLGETQDFTARSLRLQYS
jgi:hypothetical protein